MIRVRIGVKIKARVLVDASMLHQYFISDFKRPLVAWTADQLGAAHGLYLPWASIFLYLRPDFLCTRPVRIGARVTVVIVCSIS